METRLFAHEAKLEIREHNEETNEATVGGLLVPYDTLTRLWGPADDENAGYFEEFAPGSVNFSERGVFFLLGHDSARSVANLSAGTLRGESRNDGFHVEADLDLRDPDSQSLFTKTQRGDFGGLSIGFIPREEDERTEKNKKGKVTKRIFRVTNAEMLEASAVTWPAYRDTTLQARYEEGIRNRREQVSGRPSHLFRARANALRAKAILQQERIKTYAR